MDRDRFRRVADLFERARALRPDERPAWLATECDPEVRGDVESLLRSHDDAERAGALDAWRDEGAALPESIGGCRILRRIASGGMGTVYEAEQSDPRRVVALKVLRAGILDADASRRLEREASALARLSHKGIARVYAAGTDAHRPFLLMELVRGAPITEDAARRGLDTGARLALLAEVCDAVAHAHQHGVIHRDLKPSNILVDEAGQPKVLDFGLARLLEDKGPLPTRTGLVLGTPAYMSPEQAAGDPHAIDTRSDVYALGVLAYELLAGKRPFPEEGDYAAIRRRVEEDPPSLGSADRRLRGDISHIVGKAMAREKERRYAGAAAFADDVRRHLLDQPILARPLTAGYQIRKFVRRHRALVGGAAATFLALLAGLVVALQLAADERAQRRVADERTEAAARDAYRAQIAAAMAAFQAHDAASAREHLKATDPARRGFEYDLVAARLDRSLASRPPSVTWTTRLAAEGGRLAVASVDGNILILDLAGGASAAEVAVPRPDAAAVSLSRDGALLAVATAGGRFSLLDARAGTTTREFETGLAGIERIRLSPDGGRLAVRWRAPDAVAHLSVVSASTGSTLATWPCDAFRISALAWSPDGDRIAAGSATGSIRLWAPDGPLLRDLKIHSNTVLAADFSPDGLWLASGGVDKEICITSVETGEVAHRLTGHAGFVESVRFDPSGENIASVAAEGMARIWDARSGRLIEALPGHLGPIYEALWCGDGRLATVGTDGVRFWAPGAADALEVLRGHAGVAEGNPSPYVYAVAFSPDGHLVASGGWDRTVRLWDPETGMCLAALDAGTRVETVACDATRVFANGGAWALANGRPVAIGGGLGGTDLIGVSADGRRLVASRRPDSVVIDLRDGAVVATLGGRRKAPRAVALDASGTRAVTCEDGSWQLWDARTGERLRLVQTTGGLACVAFSPDGARVAVGGTAGAVVYDLAYGREARLDASGGVLAVAWSPDGSRLATGAHDNVIRLWDASTLAHLADLRGHADYVKALAWSPDGKTLASASGDNTVRLWSVRSLRERLDEAARARRLRGELLPRVEALLGSQDAAERLGAEPDPERRRVGLHLLLWLTNERARPR